MSTLLRLAFLAVLLCLIATFVFLVEPEPGDRARLTAELRTWWHSVVRATIADAEADGAATPAISISDRETAVRNASATRAPRQPIAESEPRKFAADVRPVSAAADTDTGPLIQTADMRAISGGTELESLVVVNKDITQVLRLLSEASGRKILASENVRGPVTVSLPHTTVNEALDKLVKIKGLVAKTDGDYTLIYTRQEFEEMERHAAELSFRLYRPKYIAASDLKELIVTHLTEKGKVTTTKPNQIGIAPNSDSAGGDSLSVGDAILVQDVESRLKELDRIVAEIDKRPPQVLIESVLLSVDLDDQHQMGVNFALLNGGLDLAVFGNGSVINGAAGFPPSSIVNGAGKVQGAFGDNAHGLKFGTARSDLTALVKLLETVGHTSIVANPKVLALNKQRAEIIVGSRLGYRTTTTTETATIQSVQFLDVGTQLRMRPFVQPDGLIRMELHPERSSGRINPDTQLPEEETSAITTNLTVPSGTTIVIGGLIEEQQQRTVQQIPVLGSLKYVGHLFRDETMKTTRHEIVILITPRLVDDGDCDADDATERWSARRDALERQTPCSSRVALSHKYLDQACACRDQGDVLKALELVELAIHFDPFNEDAIALRRELQPLCPGASAAESVAAPSNITPASGSTTAAPRDALATPKRRAWEARR